MNKLGELLAYNQDSQKVAQNEDERDKMLALGSI